MFEDYTYERLLEDVLNSAPEGIDTRQGSIFYDAVSGILLKVAKLYTDLDLVVEMTTVATATDEALDTKAAEYGITRLAATRAKYRAIFDGTTPEVGERFYYDLSYFVLRQDENTGVYYFEAEVAGESGNNIYAGTPAVPVNNIEGLISATFGEIYENGSDAEDDESLRNRVFEKIFGPAENGNKQHYKTWCESIDGVGRARIVPLWNGENTVKVHWHRSMSWAAASKLTTHGMNSTSRPSDIRKILPACMKLTWTMVFSRCGIRKRVSQPVM